MKKACAPILLLIAAGCANSRFGPVFVINKPLLPAAAMVLPARDSLPEEYGGFTMGMSRRAFLSRLVKKGFRIYRNSHRYRTINGRSFDTARIYGKKYSLRKGLRKVKGTFGADRLLGLSLYYSGYGRYRYHGWIKRFGPPDVVRKYHARWFRNMVEVRGYKSGNNLRINHYGLGNKLGLLSNGKYRRILRSMMKYIRKK